MGIHKQVYITDIRAEEILDSRGNPTVRAYVYTSDGSVGEASVPSGASTGVHEALELRDGTKRFSGKGVQKAVKNITTAILPLLKHKSIFDQRAIDTSMISGDGTPNKSRFGANAILAVSLACARAGARASQKPLYAYLREVFLLPYKKFEFPLPTMNIVNGGRHANNNLSVQEFMIVPKHKKFSERVRMGAEIFHELHNILQKKNFSTGVGDEGGFAPELPENEHALKLIMRAIEQAGYEPGKQVYLASDIAASEFFQKGVYNFYADKDPLTPEQLIKVMETWVRKYPFISIEDPLDQDDWEHWQKLTKRVGKSISLVGDDLFVTNVERIRMGIDLHVANAVLIKLNQIGSLSETIDAILLAQKNKYKISVSHRSGETADTFIADLAVAVNAEYIKSGSLSRSERVEKYNRLMHIEKELQQ